MRVEPAAVNTAITVQIYDPAFMFTGINCANSTGRPTVPPARRLEPTERPRSTDANILLGLRRDRRQLRQRHIARFRNTAPATTTRARSPRPRDAYVLRHANDTFNPKVATPIPGCTKQFVGHGAADEHGTPQWTNAAKTIRNANYNLPEGASVYHQWVDPVHLHAPPSGVTTTCRSGPTCLVGGTAVPNINPTATPTTSLIYTGNSNVTATTREHGRPAPAATPSRCGRSRATRRRSLHRRAGQREHADPPNKDRQHRHVQPGQGRAGQPGPVHRLRPLRHRRRVGSPLAP